MRHYPYGTALKGRWIKAICGRRVEAATTTIIRELISCPECSEILVQTAGKTLKQK